jgi:hypothetical protein
MIEFTLFISPPATVDLNLTEISASRPPLFGCPGDTVMYNCSIMSPSHLVWVITVPGETPVEIVLDHSTTQNVMMNHGTGISVVLARYTTNDFINAHSTILLTLITPVMNGTTVNCKTDGESAVEIVLLNVSGTPCMLYMFTVEPSYLYLSLNWAALMGIVIDIIALPWI